MPDATLIEYVADGQNRRIGRKVNGVFTQRFLYQSQLAPVAELDGTGAVVSRFVYGTRVNVPDYMVRGGVTYRIVTDHLGSVRLVINMGTGAVVQQVSYDEFGRETANTNSGFQPFGYAGGLSDPATTLLRFGARDYEPASGRWTAKDPIGFGGGSSNLFGYTGNDPVNFVDPTGKIIFLPILAAAGVGCATGLITDFLAQALEGAACWDVGRSITACVVDAVLGAATAGLDQMVAAVRLARATARSAEVAPTVYRQGTFADEATDWSGNYVKGKQWATENPLTTPDYAKKYGLPAENTGRDWVVSGRVQVSLADLVDA